MESKRQERISKLFQQDIADILRLDSRGLFDGAMLTVTKVNVSPDLSVAKIYVSVFASNDNNATLEKIRAHGREIRHKLSQRVKHQLRAVPELQFHLDDSLDYIDNIDNLLKES